MSRTKRTSLCLRCRNLKCHEARGLCKCCYNHVREHRAQGLTLNDFPLQGENRKPHPTPLDKRKDPSFIPMREARKDYQ